MRPFAGKIIPAELFMTVSSVLYLLVPLFSRIIIDEHLRPMKGTFQQLLLLAGAMFLARALGEVIFILSSRVFNEASIQYANHLRNLAYEKIQKLSLGSLSKRTPGDLIRRVMEDTTTVKEFISDGGRWAVEQTIIFLVVFIILLLTNYKLTLLVFRLPVVLPDPARDSSIYYKSGKRQNSGRESFMISSRVSVPSNFGKEDMKYKFGATRNWLKYRDETPRAPLPSLTFLRHGEFLVLYEDMNLDGTLVWCR